MRGGGRLGPALCAELVGEDRGWACRVVTQHRGEVSWADVDPGAAWLSCQKSAPGFAHLHGNTSNLRTQGVLERELLSFHH